MNTTDTANTATELDLVMERDIRATRKRVFEAFTTPEVLSQWFGPRGMRIIAAEVDAKVGGRYRITMCARTGEAYTVLGEYREVKPFERLVFTWQWEQAPMNGMGSTLVSVDLSERGGTTHLRLRHSGFPDAAARDNHRSGWGSSLNCLLDTVDERGSAATIALYGDPRSTYTRSVRMALAEKGIAYSFQQEGPAGETIAKLHPFKKIPVLSDGDMTLFESSAIMRYVEEAFDGPSLLPGNMRLRAVMEQWVSAINCYIYPTFVRNYVIPYVFPGGPDGKPDRRVIDAALPQMREMLSKLDAAYGASEYLAGDGCSMADLLLAPILDYVKVMPEGSELLAPVARVRHAHDVMTRRASFIATQPK